MIQFRITASNGICTWSYITQARSSADAVMAAIDRFGICAATVRPV